MMRAKDLLDEQDRGGDLARRIFNLVRVPRRLMISRGSGKAS